MLCDSNEFCDGDKGCDCDNCCDVERCPKSFFFVKISEVVKSCVMKYRTFKQYYHSKFSY